MKPFSHAMRLFPVILAFICLGIHPFTGCTHRMEETSDRDGDENSLILHALSNEDFNQMVLASPVPVLVDFWAVWCPPCRMMEPSLDAIAREKEGELRVVKVNVDDAQALAQRFKIRALPTLMLVREGRAVAMSEGAMRQSGLEEWIGEQLGIIFTAETGTP